METKIGYFYMSFEGCSMRGFAKVGYYNYKGGKRKDYAEVTQNKMIFKGLLCLFA